MTIIDILKSVLDKGGVTYQPLSKSVSRARVRKHGRKKDAPEFTEITFISDGNMVSNACGRGEYVGVLLWVPRKDFEATAGVEQ